MSTVNCSVNCHINYIECSKTIRWENNFKTILSQLIDEIERLTVEVIDMNHEKRNIIKKYYKRVRKILKCSRYCLLENSQHCLLDYS